MHWPWVKQSNGKHAHIPPGIHSPKGYVLGHEERGELGTGGRKASEPRDWVSRGLQEGSESLEWAVEQGAVFWAGLRCPGEGVPVRLMDGQSICSELPIAFALSKSLDWHFISMPWNRRALPSWTATLPFCSLWFLEGELFKDKIFFFPASKLFVTWLSNAFHIYCNRWEIKFKTILYEYTFTKPSSPWV